MGFARLSTCLLAMALAPAAGARGFGQGLSFSTGVPTLRDGSGRGITDRGDPERWLPSDDPPPGERLGLRHRISALTRGRVQLEGGYAYVYDRFHGVRVSQHSVPDLLLRVGIDERFELRIGWPGYVATHYDGRSAPDSSSDTLDPNVGFMWDLWGQDGWIPQTAVLASVPIELEGDPFALRSLQPLSQLLYCWYLTDRFALGGTTGFALFRENGDHFTQLQQSANADYLLSDRLDVFAEWEVLVDCNAADDGSQHLFSSGVSFLWSESLQLSWRVGTGLNQRAPDFLTDVRFALRF